LALEEDLWINIAHVICSKTRTARCTPSICSSCYQTSRSALWWPHRCVPHATWTWLEVWQHV